MREYMGLYRGKRKDNGEWVEGSLVNDRGNYCIYLAVTDISYGDGGNRRRIGRWYVVDPETVGECMGETDAYGALIFEGDILQDTRSGNVRAVERHGGSFALVNSKRYMFWNCWAIDYEIIGNIYDNPELLKEEP